ncbi:hypothetical protein [Nibribacter koreensis]|uniref:Uncharacterized protein n=1 Tax=Nibribacter koreensis TaxID=1084519 RepID=A0ABP8FNM1_9BACT
MEFKPPIAERETNELIRIASSPGKWNPLAVEQAKQELINRQVTEQTIKKKVAIWDRFYERKRQATLDKRFDEGYDWLDLLFNPIHFLMEILTDWHLKEDGYIKKHLQRRIFLSFLGLLIVLVYFLL